MSRKFAIAFALCTMFGAMAAAPASAAQTMTVRVPYADLNLNTTSGASRMLNRIGAAAETVCGDHSGLMNMRERREIRTCRTETTQNVVATLNHPVVTAMYYHRQPTIIVASAN